MWNVGQMALRSQLTRHEYLLKTCIALGFKPPTTKSTFWSLSLGLVEKNVQIKVFRGTNMFLNVTGGNISVVLNCNIGRQCSRNTWSINVMISIKQRIYIGSFPPQTDSYQRKLVHIYIFKVQVASNQTNPLSLLSSAIKTQRLERIH